MGVGISDKLNEAIDDAFTTVQKFNDNTQNFINEKSEKEFYALIKDVAAVIENHKRKDFTLSYGAYFKANDWIFRARIYDWENHGDITIYNTCPMEALRALKNRLTVC